MQRPRLKFIEAAASWSALAFGVCNRPWRPWGCADGPYRLARCQGANWPPKSEFGTTGPCNFWQEMQKGRLSCSDPGPLCGLPGLPTCLHIACSCMLH